MLFRSTDLPADFERLTKGLNFGPEFDRMIDDLSTFVAAPTNKPRSDLADVDAVRSNEAFELFIDLPGIDASDVNLTVDGRTLTVEAERTFTVADGDEHVHAGRRHGVVKRSVELAEDLDVDAVTAHSDNGVLIVSVPVIATPEPRKIQITTEG